MNKKEFDEKYVSKNLVVNCKTEELANEFLALAHSFGYKWFSGDSYLLKNKYSEHKIETCYNVVDGTYGRLDSCHGYSTYYKTVEYKGEVTKFTFENFKKNNLFIKINNKLEGELFYRWLEKHNYIHLEYTREDIAKKRGYFHCYNGGRERLPLEVRETLITVYQLEGVEKEEVMTTKEKITQRYKEKVRVLNEQFKMELKELEKRKVFKPKMGEKYWFACTTGDVRDNTWGDDDIDKHRFNTENCFRTEEEAEFKKQRDLLLGKMKNWALNNNDKVINWDNEEQYKWFFYYSHKYRELATAFRVGTQDKTIYFTSEKLAIQAIEIFGENNIKKYLFNVK